MTPNMEATTLILHIDAGEDIGADELDQLTRQLRDEIQDLDVESVELLKGGATPEGAKAMDAIALGGLIVQVLPSVLPKLIGFLQAWTMGRESRKVKIVSRAGDRSVELEYPPKTVTQAELKMLVKTLTEALAEKRQE